MGSENRDTNTASVKKINYADLGSFFENMGMMIKAGIPVSEAVELLRDESGSDHPSLTPALGVMADELSMGSTLENAMRETGSFPQYAVDMTGASEYTGRLEKTMFHLSDYYRRENAMHSTLLSAVRYPLILLGLVILVLLAMIFLVFPAFYGVYENLTGSISSSSFNYINLSFTICRIMLVIMAVLVAVLLIGLIMWKTGKKAAVRRLISRVSSFRNLIDNLDLYRFTTCFDMFIASGEMQEEALKKSLSVVEGESVMAKLRRAGEKMDSGLTFSQAAYEEQLYDPVNNRMLIPAERSGMLDTILQKVLDNLEENNDAYLSHIANTVEPLLTGLLMIFIGIMLISLMLPLIGIMNSIG